MIAEYEITNCITPEEFLDMRLSVGWSINKEQKWRKDYFPSENTVSNSVAFFTGGMYEGQYLVSCEISTASKEETAMGIFRVFSKAIKKLCKYREGTYWYTEGVRQLNGVRLITMSYEEDPMYDIAGAGIGR